MMVVIAQIRLFPVLFSSAISLISLFDFSKQEIPRLLLCKFGANVEMLDILRKKPKEHKIEQTTLGLGYKEFRRVY